MELLLFPLWALTGGALGATLNRQSGDTFAWTPVAMLFGPLWAIIAEEQRLVRRDRSPPKAV